MKNYIRILKGHKAVAQEHIDNNPILKHTPTYFQAMRTILSNLYKGRRYLEADGAYIVYEVETKYTLGLESVALVVALYCPIEMRGNGYISKLIDKIPHNTVLGFKGKDDYEIAKLYKIR